MEKVEWKVEGMDCTNCALTINQYLNKQGLKNVKVNFIGGDVSFEMNEQLTKETVAKGIEKSNVNPYATHVSGGAYSFFNEPMGAVRYLHAGVYPGHVLFWT